MSVMPQPAARGLVRRHTRHAWWSLLLFPISFAAAMVVGEGTAALLGYSDPSLASTPWWVIMTSAGLALVAFASPIAATARLSQRAVDAGEPGGRVPLFVAATAVGGFVVLNLVSGLVQLVAR
jgi:hypothetical protein